MGSQSLDVYRNKAAQSFFGNNDKNHALNLNYLNGISAEDDLSSELK